MENEIIDTGIEIEYKREVNAYFYLFSFFADQYELILTNGEMDDIAKAVNNFKKIMNGEDRTT